jgi:hypothetical protein
MKLSEIKEPGFYWNRLDEHRAWAIVFVTRRAQNPLHPLHGEFIIKNGSGSNDSRTSSIGDFIGPITPPQR